ncbi:hypothetical protein KQI65_15415 [bacterium]|nr:hypothetical protein [bacterium]
MKHLDMKDILTLARRGERTSHLDACSFCREHYQMAVDYLAFSPDMVRGEDQSINDTGHQSMYGAQTYRLAAQTVETASPMFRLRRTWYFDNNARILRVIEDIPRGILTGFFIGEREDRALGIRFDGLDEEYHPDQNGVFEIGSANINIEPMKVTLVDA